MHARSHALVLWMALAAPLAAQQDDGKRPPEAAPAQADPAPAAPAKDDPVVRGVPHFPLEPGRRWQYQVQFSIDPAGGEETPSERTPHTLDVYVVDPQPLGDARVAVVEWSLDRELSQRDFYTVGPNGVGCVKRIQGFGEHMKEYLLTPAQVVAREGMAAGQEWRWEGKVNGVAGVQTFKVLREETIETPAGSFNALVLEVQFEGDDDSRGWKRLWLAAGVGLVKDESEVRTAGAVFRTEGVLTRFEAPK